jgi:alpha-glucosidase
VDGEITTPWRVVMLADNLNELVNSDIISNLNPAPDTELFSDQSWIKPGRAVCSFFSSHKEDYCFTMPYEQHFIDRASELTYEYTLIDDGWEKKWDDKWKTLKELCDYARKKNVSVMVWKHSSQIDNPNNDYEQMRIFLDSIKAAGTVGIKIDFMNGETKKIIDFDIRALQLCAERRLMLDFHGCQKPSGESRTYPNEITREGIRGLELNSMPEGPIPGNHNVVLVFTRCILNNSDYTPVGFSTPGPTSWAHQLATAYAFTSPLLVMPEHPDTLFLNKTIAATLPLLKTIPTVWDETIVLPESSVAETAILARRSGDDWYLVVLNGKRPKQLNVKTDFLKEGKWNAFMVKDDAARQDNMIVEERILQANELLNIQLNNDGGYVAKFVKR